MVLKRSGGSIILCAGITGMEPESGYSGGASVATFAELGAAEESRDSSLSRPEVPGGVGFRCPLFVLACPSSKMFSREELFFRRL